MDVAKYIALFLLKNNSCYIQGLGNIELRRRPASYDGAYLRSAIYDVVVAPIGGVDDALLNFISTNEQVSTGAASNALKLFSDNAKQDLISGKEVVIPSLGVFLQLNEKLQFLTSPLLQIAYPAIAAEKNAPRLVNEIHPVPQPVVSYEEVIVVEEEEASIVYPEQEEETKKGFAAWKIILVVLFLLAIIGVVGYGLKDMWMPLVMPNTDTVTSNIQFPMVDSAVNNTLPATQDSIPVIDTENTMAMPEDMNGAVMQPQTTDPNQAILTAPVQTGQTLPANTIMVPVSLETYKVLLNTYDERGAAEKRFNTLRSAGNKVELIVEDSSTYNIVIAVTAPASKKKRVLDSLKNKFNPLGVELW